LPRTKCSQKRRRRLIFLLHAAVNQASGSIFATSIVTVIEATNVIATIDDLTIVIEMINTMIVLVATKMDSMNSKSYEKNDDHKCNYFKKKSNEAGPLRSLNRETKTLVGAKGSFPV
jgi:hypothetical protein